MRRGEEKGRSRNRFAWSLGAIVVLALVVRCGYIAGAKKGPCPSQLDGQVIAMLHSECMGVDGQLNDQYWYSTTADELSHGHFFGTKQNPIADHPPLQVFVLAGTSFAFEHLPLSKFTDAPRSTLGPRIETHVREQRYTMALVGALVVLLVGLLGRRVGGDRVGLIAALLAALYPNMWVPDGLLFAEPIARLCLLGALLLAFRCRTRASTFAVLGLGALCGLAALSRQELILLLPALAIPIAWKLRAQGGKAVAVMLLTATAGTAIIVGPWAAFNLSRFKDPVLISTNDGITFAGANCERAFNGTSTGLWVVGAGCLDLPKPAADYADQSEIERAWRSRAFDYMRAHKGRMPWVIAARIGRTWDVYRPLDMITYEQGENKERPVSWAGLITFYPIALAAIAGGVVPFRRRHRFALWILCVPLLIATFSVMFASGSVRNRATSEPSLVILAAVAIGAVVEAYTARHRRESSFEPGVLASP